jgi:hypothetical protein
MRENMKTELFNQTKTAAYYLWKLTGCSNTLNLWYCAEDVACFFDFAGFDTPSAITAVLSGGVYADEYISFVRNISYKLYTYTGNNAALANWYAAERLIQSDAWLASICAMVEVIRTDRQLAAAIRSDEVRARYATPAP